MSAINVLTFPGIFDYPQTCCDCACGHPETHIPVLRVPVVSARWTVETDSNGVRRLVERWSTNRPQ